MSKLFTLTLLLCASFFIQAQTDTLFFNEYGVRVEKADALYYELISNTAQTGYVDQFYLDGTAYGFAAYTYGQKNGPFRTYFKDGTIKELGNYLRGNLNGTYKVNHPNGQLRIHSTISREGLNQVEKIIEAYDSLGNAQVTDGNGDYSNLNDKGILEEGEVKDFQKVGTWTGKKGEELIYEETYKKGSLKKGERHSDNGKVIKYDQVSTQVEFPGGMPKWNLFLRKNLNYPREAKRKNIEGPVEMSFRVDKEGNIIHIEVLEAPDSVLAEEAKRVLAESAVWTPATNRGIPRISEMKLRINFRLM